MRHTISSTDIKPQEPLLVWSLTVDGEGILILQVRHINSSVWHEVLGVGPRGRSSLYKDVDDKLGLHLDEDGRLNPSGQA